MGESPFAEICHAKKRAFLAAYAQCGNKSLAAQMAGIVKQTISTRQWREDPEFQAGPPARPPEVDTSRTITTGQLITLIRKTGGPGHDHPSFDHTAMRRFGPSRPAPA